MAAAVAAHTGMAGIAVVIVVIVAVTVAGIAAVTVAGIAALATAAIAAVHTAMAGTGGPTATVATGVTPIATEYFIKAGRNGLDSGLPGRSHVRRKSMRQTAMLAAALSGALYLASGMIAPAYAGIECKGRLQYNSAVNAWIGSPYCGDNLIAAIARSSGMNVSARAVRQNPSVKEEACRFAGIDIRIRDLCAGHLPEDDDGGGRS